MPNPGERVNVFQRENVPLSLCVAHQPDASASAAVRNVLARLGVPDEKGGVRITWQNPR